MSYAGTYGNDEACDLHDTYWRSCAECSLVGPRATQAQINAAFERRQREIEQSNEEERARTRMFEKLSDAEKIIAQTLYGNRRIPIEDAVRGWQFGPVRHTDSHYVGEARSACRKAREIALALKVRVPFPQE